MLIDEMLSEYKGRVSGLSSHVFYEVLARERMGRSRRGNYNGIKTARGDSTKESYGN